MTAEKGEVRKLADLIHDANQRYGRTPINRGGPPGIWSSLARRHCEVIAEAILEAGYSPSPQLTAVAGKQGEPSKASPIIQTQALEEHNG